MANFVQTLNRRVTASSMWPLAFAHRCTQSPPPGLSRRYVALDGLRGLAAAVVVVFHYQLFFAGPNEVGESVEYFKHLPWKSALTPIYRHGLYAVHFFWMLSGFVFAATYHRRKVTTRMFLVHRFARLYPLHLLTLGVVAVIQTVALEVDGRWLVIGNNDTYHFILNLLFVSGWWHSTSGSFNAVIWSVSAELFAYALFWVTLTWLLRWGIVLPLAIAACARFAVMLDVAPDSVGVILCVFFFFTGTAMFATLSAATAPREKILVGAGCACAIALGATLPWDHAIWELMLPGLFGALILLGYWVDEALGFRVRTLFGGIGDLSYGIYLWHLPILLIVCLLMPSGLLFDVTRQGWFVIVFLGLAIAAAMVSYRFFERPARDFIRRIGQPRSGSHPARSH